jgi:hypothetical protein
MTSRDFQNVGVCDHCANGDAFIVGEDEDGRFCDKCEEVADDDVFFGNGYTQKLKDGIQGIAIACFLAGFFLAAFLFEGDEIAAVVRRLI